MTTIIGAGMAGLLAGNMLRHYDPVIVEAQNRLPNNHSAVLRFRSSQVGDVLGIPFKKVLMIKNSIPWKNLIADALAYSDKNTGVLRSDRSITAGFVVDERYIAPPDLIEQMARNLQLSFGIRMIESGNVNLRFECGTEELPINHFKGPFISTMPMPVLMQLLDYPEKDKFNFNYEKGVNIRAKIERCDAYVSIAVPTPEEPFSRISITGDELIIECPRHEKIVEPHVSSIVDHVAWDYLGIVDARVSEVRAIPQTYAKIAPVDDIERKQFIHWATDEFNIFSLGRFATWRPKLQLDDLVNDVRLIDKWIRDNSRYEIARSR